MVPMVHTRVDARRPCPAGRHGCHGHAAPWGPPLLASVLLAAAWAAAGLQGAAGSCLPQVTAGLGSLGWQAAVAAGSWVSVSQDLTLHWHSLLTTERVG